ncbi:MAG: aldolase/citrate lyase family protein, partial [Parasphingorhabdus sp.]
MAVNMLGEIIAPLFVPAHRPELFAKAAASGADAIILDLEDAVPEDAKEAARAALTAQLARTGSAARFNGLPVLVRINAAGTRWHDADLAVLRDMPVAGIILPKAETAADIARAALHHPIIVLVETALGLAEARQIAQAEGVARLAFGS